MKYTDKLLNEDFYDMGRAKGILLSVYVNPTKDEMKKYVATGARGFIDLKGNLYLEGYEPEYQYNQNVSQVMHGPILQVIQRKNPHTIPIDYNRVWTDGNAKFGITVQRADKTYEIYVGESVEFSEYPERITDLFAKAKIKNPNFSFSTTSITEYFHEIPVEYGHLRGSLIEVSSNPNFKAWFGASKVKDKYGKPRVVYHGTFSEIESFELNKTNPENFFGQGFYFTSSKPDVNHNYATISGPDPKSKFNTVRDDYYSENNEEAEADFKAKYGYEPLEYNDRQVAIRDFVNKQLGWKHEGAVFPCYLRMLNPCYIGFGSRDTFFPYHQDQDEDGDDYGEPTGMAMDVLLYLQNYEEDWGNLWDHLFDYGGINAFTLYRCMADSDVFHDDVGAGEVFSDMIQSLGFDGIIQKPKTTFPRMKKIDRAIHYIVFEPTQIKSAIGNNGNFSLTSNNLKESELHEAVNFDYYKDKIDKETFDWLRALDPTNDAKYARWIIEWFWKSLLSPKIETLNNFLRASEAKPPVTLPLTFRQVTGQDSKIWSDNRYGGAIVELRRFYFEDCDKITEDLINYTKLKNKKQLNHEQGDDNIMNIKGFRELWHLVNDIYKNELELITQNEPIDPSQVDKWLENSEWLVVIPKTEAAAKKYGANTRWCTAAANNNMFSYYTQEEYPDSKLIIIIDKTEKRKWQLHLESNQWMDDMDDDVGSRVEFVERLPYEVKNAIFVHTQSFAFNPHKLEFVKEKYSNQVEFEKLKIKLERCNFGNMMMGTDSTTSITDFLDEKFYLWAYTDYVMQNSEGDFIEEYQYGYDHPWSFLKDQTPENIEDAEDCESCDGTGHALYFRDKDNYWSTGLTQEQYDKVLAYVTEKFPQYVENFTTIYKLDSEGEYYPVDDAAMEALMKALGQKCRFCKGTGKEDSSENAELWSEEQRSEAAQESEAQAMDEYISRWAKEYDNENFTRSDIVKLEYIYDLVLTFLDIQAYPEETFNTLTNLIVFFDINP